MYTALENDYSHDMGTLHNGQILRILLQQSFVPVLQNNNSGYNIYHTSWNAPIKKRPPTKAEERHSSKAVSEVVRGCIQIKQRGILTQ